MVQICQLNCIVNQNTPRLNSTGVKLSQLLIECYDLEVLALIRNSLGAVTKIDAKTANSENKGYARLCIQIDLSKPLHHSIKIDHFTQFVQYEGLKGRLVKGYRNEGME